MLKRCFDFLASLLALLMLAPIIAICGCCVAMKIGSPVLFSQVRPGLDGRPFRMYKFRTMSNATDPNGNLLPDRDRLSTFGQLLRSSSLDELPELWNVMCGDMSLVGPRPLLPEYLPLYSRRQSRRHDVRPGITGWAQVNGRNRLSWASRFEMDVWYVENQSFLLDLRILCLTVDKVMRRADIEQEGHETMPKFEGNPVDELIQIVHESNER